MGKQARLKRERSQHQRRSLVDLYVDAAAVVMPEHFRADRCLNATRITIEVLEQFGIKARALVCHAFAFNKVGWAYVTAHGNEPGFRIANEPGAWSVGVAGPVPGSPGFPAHLVAAVGLQIVDAASGQFARPARDILIPETFTAVAHETFFRGETPAIFELRTGCVLSYKALPDDQSHERAPGFQRSSWNLAVTEEIIGRIQKDIQ